MIRLSEAIARAHCREEVKFIEKITRLKACLLIMRVCAN